MKLTYDNLRDVAHIVHAANNAYRFILGEPLNARFDALLEMQRDALTNAVRRIVDGEIRTPEASHQAWYDDRQRKGWAYGAAQDNAAMLHPNMLPFNELPDAQKYKDALFVNIVKAFAGIGDGPVTSVDTAKLDEAVRLAAARKEQIDVLEEQIATERANILAERQQQASLSAQKAELEGQVTSLTEEVAKLTAALNQKPEEPPVESELDVGDEVDPTPEPPPIETADPAPEAGEQPPPPPVDTATPNS